MENQTQQEQVQQPIYNLQLPADMVDVIFEGLGKLTADRSYNTIKQMEIQIGAQNHMAQQEAELRAKKEAELRADAELLGKTPEGVSKRNNSKSLSKNTIVKKLPAKKQKK